MPESSSCSSHNLDPPISNLDNDILWYIFSLNANMEHVTENTIPALLTLQYTSQVCSNWRALAVGSPSLWGRVLNIKPLSDMRIQRRKEVMTRTGKAPLHIKGSDHLDSFYMEDFLRGILNENWDRIQSLHFRFGQDSYPHAPRKWSSIFQRPAPSLQSFRLSWPGLHKELCRPDFILFSNEAPALRMLSARNVNLNLTTLSIQFPNIRCLRLVLVSSISLSEFLCALRDMPLLEELKASRSGRFITVGKASTSLSQVILPRLTKICVSGGDGEVNSLKLLTHIIPADGCVLSFFNSYVASIPDHITLELCHDILSTYSTYCQELVSATKLDTTLSRNSFIFSFYLPSNRIFFFGIDSDRIALPEHIIPTLLPSLTALQIDKIKKLELYIAFTDPLLSNSNFLDFILSLVSVQELVTDPHTLSVLTFIQSNKRIITIPALEGIDLDVVHAQSSISLIRDFLISRIEMGIPVDTVTLKIESTVINLDILEEVQGLAVEILYSRPQDPLTHVALRNSRG